MLSGKEDMTHVQDKRFKGFCRVLIVKKKCILVALIASESPFQFHCTDTDDSQNRIYTKTAAGLLKNKVG